MSKAVHLIVLNTFNSIKSSGEFYFVSYEESLNKNYSTVGVSVLFLNNKCILKLYVDLRQKNHESKCIYIWIFISCFCKSVTCTLNSLRWELRMCVVLTLNLGLTLKRVIVKVYAYMNCLLPLIQKLYRIHKERVETHNININSLMSFLFL